MNIKSMYWKPDLESMTVETVIRGTILYILLTADEHEGAYHDGIAILSSTNLVICLLI